MGTPDFALPSLEMLNQKHNILSVYTQPDKPVGRKQVITPPDVKMLALKLGLNVKQPISLKNEEVILEIESLNPDLIVVAAYAKILPKKVLEIPKYGCINVHASLLPKYRGAAPIQWSVINGDLTTGVTIMQMAEGLDTGDILSQKEIPINIDDTSESMFEKLSTLGAYLLLDTIEQIQKNNTFPLKQNDSMSSYAPMIDKSLAKIDFNKTAYEVHKLICGMYSWPVAYTLYEGKRLKVFKSRMVNSKGNPGEILSIEPFVIACKENSIEIIEVQLEGGKRMEAHFFTIGHKLQIGDIFGG